MAVMKHDLEAGAAALHEVLQKHGFASYVSAEQINEATYAVLKAVDDRHQHVPETK